jgi:ATP-binding cassette subfamily B protein
MTQSSNSNPPNTNTWRVYRHFYSFLLKYKNRFVLFIIVSVVLAVIQGVQPYFYKLFIETIKDKQGLDQIFLAYFLIRASEVIIGPIHNYLGDTFLLKAARDARIAVFKKVQQLDFAYHLSKSTGSLISAFKRGDSAFFNLFFEINFDSLQLLLDLCVTLFFLLRVDVFMAAATLACFLATLLFAKYILQKNMYYRQRFNQVEDEISGIIVDNMINFETVKMFSQENYELKRLKQKFQIWLKRLWQFAYTYYFMDLVVGIIGQTSVLLCVYLGLVKLGRQDFAVSDFVMIIGYSTTFYPKFFQLMRKLRHIVKSDVDLRKYFRPLNLETKVRDPRQPRELKSPCGEIEFQNISFAYEGKAKEALIDFNLKIRPGQSIALVGRSGAGKTTVIKLLMRFFDPDQGCINIDGVNIRQMEKSYLRSLIGIVPQEPILFNQSIAYNIAYGQSNQASQAEIKAAAKMANLSQFIQALPQKYDTLVGERGVKLSGGQKQRLAIARMILTNPSIVIFDEATSQLDSESEQKIQDALNKAAKNKTTIIIAHRLSTIQHVDKIVVVDEGKIVETGSHRYLLTQEDSLYKNFWSLQMIS